MAKYCVAVSIPEGKLDEIMTRLQNAQDEIYKCYSELEQLGVLEIKRPPEAPAAKRITADLFRFRQSGYTSVWRCSQSGC